MPTFARSLSRLTDLCLTPRISLSIVFHLPLDTLPFCTCSAQRLLLVYADSSDEEDKDEESQMEDVIDEGFSMHTHPGKRADSLREIVFLKDSKPGSYSFNEK